MREEIVMGTFNKCLADQRSQNVNNCDQPKAYEETYH